MYEIPLSILLFPYVIVLFFVAFFSLVNIYHLVHYGAATVSSYAVTFLYFAGIVVILAATAFALAGTTWSDPLPVEIPSFGVPSFDSFDTGNFPSLEGQP
jgi:hypothetical protein